MLSACYVDRLDLQSLSTFIHKCHLIIRGVDMIFIQQVFRHYYLNLNYLLSTDAVMYLDIFNTYIMKLNTQLELEIQIKFKILSK